MVGQAQEGHSHSQGEKWQRRKKKSNRSKVNPKPNGTNTKTQGSRTILLGSMPGLSDAQGGAGPSSLRAVLIVLGVTYTESLRGCSYTPEALPG